MASSAEIPRDYWREVPCGHPPDPVAMYGEMGPVCHCGRSLAGAEALPERPPEAPGPIVACEKCGCAVAIPPPPATPPDSGREEGERPGLTDDDGPVLLSLREEVSVEVEKLGWRDGGGNPLHANSPAVEAFGNRLSDQTRDLIAAELRQLAVTTSPPDRGQQELRKLIRALEFRPERSRPVWRNKHTGTEVVVLDLQVNDHGGFQGGCRQFYVHTDEGPPPGPPLPPDRVPRGYCLAAFLEHWEPTGRFVPATQPHSKPDHEEKRYAAEEIHRSLLEPGGPIAAATNAVVGANLTDDMEQACEIALQIIGPAVHHAFPLSKPDPGEGTDRG